MPIERAAATFLMLGGEVPPFSRRHRSRWARGGSLAAGSLALLVGWGCGARDEFSRVGLSGKVTLGGKPLPSGTITFVPLRSGPSVQGPIADGGFVIARSEGPAPGPHRVEIYSVQPTGRRVPDADNPGSTIEESRNVVAGRYNLRSELRAEVERDGQQSDFTLNAGK